MNKRITLNEDQLNYLISLMEAETAPDFEDGDVKEFNDPSENSTTATVHDYEGKPLRKSGPTADKIAAFKSQDNGWMNAVGGTKAMY